MNRVFILIIIKNATGELLDDIDIVMVSTSEKKIYETKEKILKEKMIITEGEEKIIIPKYDSKDVLIIESVLD